MNKLFLRPYVYTKTSLLTRVCIMLCLLVVICILLAMDKSFDALIVVATSVISSAAASLVGVKLFSNRTKLLSARAVVIDRLLSVAQGICIGLLLPHNYPLLNIVGIVFFTMILINYFFGGVAISPISAVSLCVVMAHICCPEFFGTLFVTKASILTGFPSVALIKSDAFMICGFDRNITDFLNNTIFSKFNTVIPEGFMSLLWDTHFPVAAARYNIVIFLIMIILCALDNNKLIASTCFLVVYSLCVYFFTPMFFGGFSVRGDVVLALNTSALLFGVTFLMCEVGKLPSKKRLLLIYGAIGAVVTFFIVGASASACSICVSALVMNFVAILLKHTEDKQNFTLLKAITERLSK